MQIPLRYEHFVLLNALADAKDGQLPFEKLPIKGMVAALLVRRNLAEWVRDPPRASSSAAVALKITDAGLNKKSQFQDALTP